MFIPIHHKESLFENQNHPSRKSATLGLGGALFSDKPTQAGALLRKIAIWLDLGVRLDGFVFADGGVDALLKIVALGDVFVFTRAAEGNITELAFLRQPGAPSHEQIAAADDQ